MSAEQTESKQAPNQPPDQQGERRRRGIYLLPNLFTTGGLFGGFYAIVAAMQDQYEIAAIAVFIAMILDSLDGRVARMTNTQTEFGAEYDSLADVISFGVAPALIIYQWSLEHMRDWGASWGKVGWLAAFVYVACAALRLARFNTQIGTADKRYFTGIPSPAAAGLVVGTVWVFHDLTFQGRNLQILALLITLSSGLLMVSNVSYYSFKDFDLRNRVPFVVMLGVVLVFALLTIDPPKVLFAAFLLYTLSGPALWLSRRYRRSQRRSKKDGG